MAQENKTESTAVLVSLEECCKRVGISKTTGWRCLKKFSENAPTRFYATARTVRYDPAEFIQWFTSIRSRG